MNIMFYIVNVLGIAVEEIITLSLLRSTGAKRKLSVRTSVILLLSVLLFQSVVTSIAKKTIITVIVTFLSIIILSLVYEIPWTKRLLLSGLLSVLLILPETIFTLLLTVLSGMSAEKIRQSIPFCIICVIISRLLVLAAVKTICHFRKTTEQRISGYVFMSMIIMGIFSILYVLSDYAYSTAIFPTVVVVFLFFSDIILLYLFKYQLKEAEEKNREKMLRQQLSYKADYYRELSEKQKAANKTIHDMKNRIFALKEAIQSNPDRCMDILNRISASLSSTMPLTITGNESVDALIHSKKQTMETSGISFSHSVHISGLLVDSFDMCVLLGNMFDNAIEACENVSPQNRHVALYITQQQNYLSIHMLNSVCGPVPIIGNKIATTKQAKELHGFGLQSVREIAEKYNGTYTLKSEENEFHIYVLMQN